MSLIAEWADAWRERHPETGAWHYVNLDVEKGAGPGELAAACASGCVVTKLGAEEATAKDPDAEPRRRLEALLWIVHLAGDIHQPLHCAQRNADKGGNAVGIVLDGRIGNLHSAWDSGFFYVEHARPKDLAADLLAQECRALAAQGGVSSGDPAAWARESFGVAQSFVYPQADRTGGDFSHRDVDQAWPLLRLQLARAGLRLASLLNEAARKNP